MGKELYLHFKKRLVKTNCALVLVLFVFAQIFNFSNIQIKNAEASTPEELQQEISNLEEQINKINEDLKVKRGERKSLENEVAIFDGQINAIQLQIQATNAQLNKTQAEISNILDQIKKAEDDLARQKELLRENLKIFYEEGQISTMEVIASSDNFSEYMNRSEYLRSIQDKVVESVDKINKLMEELDLKKKDLETKKTELTTLKNQQETQKQTLNVQRAAKDSLVQITKGQEKQYSSLLAGIMEQQKKVQQELWTINNTGEFVSYGHVNQGDIIGYIGNSGYSTGCHVHFEIRIDPYTHVNPANYLGNGYFQYPVPSVPMNVPYGYSAAYFPGVFHSGQDYADGCAGTPIKAIAEGEIIRRVTGRPNTYPYSYEYGNLVMIYHTNGMFSLYGHLR